MLGVSQFLACHGIGLEQVRDLVRPLDENESLLLVGSVSEGLANPGSDLDLLLLVPDADLAGRTAHGDILRTMPAGFDLNVEIVASARAETVCRRFSADLDAGSHPLPVGAPRALVFAGADDLRLLHRLRTGIPLGPGNDAIETLRERYGLHRLPDFCMLQHVACHLRLRADAAETSLAAGDRLTPLLMVQLATQHLISAVLAAIGETNPSPKWTLRLLHDHGDALRAFDTDRLIRLALPGTSSPAGVAVEALAALSDATLARLIDKARRDGSPVASALVDLCPEPDATAARSLQESIA